MQIFPAIDIKDGKVVRLLRGDYDRVTRYEMTPVQAAADFRARGASCLHVVDLDGAKDGALSNFDAISRVAASTDLFVEVGGGIRDEKRIERYLSLGVGRVILGTAAVNNFAFLTEMVKKYGDRIALGVDARDGKVAVGGWLTVTELDGLEFCRRARDAGVKTVIYTDIARDGALSGTNLELYRELVTIPELDIVASGGISALEEIRALRDMGAAGAIVGKAIYSGTLELSAVLREARA